MIITTKYKRIDECKYIPIKAIKLDLLDYVFTFLAILIITGGLIN